MAAMPQWDTVKWLVATLAIPLALSWLGYTYQRTTLQQQSVEARLRLYTELLSKREQADTDLRKDMFAKVLDKFLVQDPGNPANLRNRMVALELLALNFHDSLNLSPLFHQLDREIASMPTAEQEIAFNQLWRTAKMVKERQAEILASVGTRRNARIAFTELDNAPMIVDEPLAFTVTEGVGKERSYAHHFTVEAIEHDAARKRLYVRVTFDQTDTQFWVDPFDFPMVNFSRISADERLSVVMINYSDKSAVLAFLYFPSSRSGVTDKPFIGEVVANLLEEAE